MQNRYVCDIGDMAKYGVLRTLASQLKLGVIWYLNPEEEGNNDGCFTEYPALESCDRELYSALQALIRTNNRSVHAIARAGILPKGTQFYEAPFSFSKVGNRLERKAYRDAWFVGASKAVNTVDIVFLDPDNGIAPQSREIWSARGNKYVSSEEIQTFINREQSVIVYHHASRHGSVAEQIGIRFRILQAIGAMHVWALTFHRQGGVRIFFVVAAEKHAEELQERSQAFIGTSWGTAGHFRMFNPDDVSDRAVPQRVRPLTTEVGYENRHCQVVIRCTITPGNGYNQVVYVMRCGHCGNEYGANGSDVFQRRCPSCLGGRPGISH